MTDTSRPSLAKMPSDQGMRVPGASGTDVIGIETKEGMTFLWPLDDRPEALADA